MRREDVDRGAVERIDERIVDEQSGRDNLSSEARCSASMTPPVAGRA
jgi:hypothetical protein